MRDAFRFSIWVLVALIGIGVAGLTLIGIPRLLSDDDCLRDWDVECTTAGPILQGLDVVGTVAGLLAARVLPIILVIAIASEATQYGADLRRRRRAERARSGRRVIEEPPPQRRGGGRQRPFGL